MTRTRVGIIEWAHRARGALAVEMAAADVLGRTVATTDDVEVRLTLVGRARRHAWRGDQWRAVVPVLHDVDLDGVGATDVLDVSVRAALDELRGAPDASAVVQADASVTAALAASYQRWLDEATAIADAPYALVATRTRREALDLDDADRRVS